jgi:hypothetical protein
MIARLGGAEGASRLEVLCERRISESVVALMRGREAMVWGVILRMVWGRSKLRRRGRWWLLLKWWIFFFQGRDGWRGKLSRMGLFGGVKTAVKNAQLFSIWSASF